MKHWKILDWTTFQRKSCQLPMPMQVEISFLRPEIGYRVYGSPVALKDNQKDSVKTGRGTHFISYRTLEKLLKSQLFLRLFSL